jgi:hypothetical protein
VVDLQGQLTLAGHGGHQALEILQPDLQDLWYGMTQFGFSVDAATQKLIDQGLAEGIIGPKFETAQQQQLDAINKLLDAIDKLVSDLSVSVPNAAALGAKGIRYSFTGLDFSISASGGKAPVADIPISGVRSAGLVQVRPGDVVGMPGLTSGGASQVHVQVVMPDGRVLAETIVPLIPPLLKKYGVA